MKPPPTLTPNSAFRTQRLPMRRSPSSVSSFLIRLAVLLVLSAALRSAAAEEPADSATVVTSSAQFWQLSGTAGDREYPLRTEIVVNYYDPEWKMLWAEWGGNGCYLDSGSQPLPIKSGQRLELDGFVRPGQQKIMWERTRIRVVEEFYETSATPLPEPLISASEFNQRIVTTEGLVTEQSETDPTHLKLVVASHHLTVTMYMRMDAQQPVPQLRGAFVRLRGVFAVKYDTTQSTPELEMWVAQPEHLQVLSWLNQDQRFAAPVTNIDALAAAPGDVLVRIEGVVRSREPGRSLTVWDDTGQVRLLTRQTEPVAPGERIEAIGYPERQGVETRLRQSLFRLRAVGPLHVPPPGTVSAAIARLRLTEQVRQLDPAEARRGYPVELRGVVTGTDRTSGTFFLQDASGGVKVVLPADGSISSPEFSSDIVLHGETRAGDFVPEVRATRFFLAAGSTLPAAHPVGYEQVMTGADYGEWVEVRGYVRAVTWESDDLARVELTTPGGELIGQVRGLERDHGLVGALVHVRAVCDAVVNDRRQLTGVLLWIPSPEFIRVHESAPADLFSTPKRTIGSLLQFGSAHELNHRVQLSGRVVLHRLGTLLYIEDGDDRLLVLSRQRKPLHPGDQVNVVGFPGHEAGRLLMRDAIYEKTGTGPAPEPQPLADVTVPNLDLDGATVSVLGRLLDQTVTATGTRLQIQRANTIFEASWIDPLPHELPIGSLLEITGVYRVQLDEYRQPRAFRIELRQPGDARVVQRPPWWTATRVLWAGGALLVAVLLTVAWALSLSRKNQLLRAADRELHQANTDLEARVAARTRDLQLEVAQRHSSEEVLAQERKLLRTLIDSLPVYLYVKNATGHFIIGNLPHARLLGADSGLAVVGKTDFDIFPPEIAERYFDDDQRVLQNGEALLLHEEPSIVHGEPRWFSTTKVPYRDRNGEIVGLIGISQDITERRHAESERETLNRQLLESSRRAGMAEVATGILHNVGNVLNSVNVSATLAVEHVRESKVSNVTKLAELLQAHADDLPAFFGSDARGAKVPEFMSSLGRELTAEQGRVVEELEHLWKKIEHIKDIISMQQSYAKVSGVAEVLELSTVIEDALRMNASSLSRHDIDVVRDYEANPTCNTERHKIVQILVNLIHNAKQACDAAGVDEKRITLRLTADDSFARIAVSDNGVGIDPDNLTRIFGHGFTTKKNGHGFGLHSGSLTAKELGGSLTAESDGPGKGATFTLSLPLAPTPVPLAAEPEALT